MLEVFMVAVIVELHASPGRSRRPMPLRASISSPSCDYVAESLLLVGDMRVSSP